MQTHCSTCKKEKEKSRKKNMTYCLECEDCTGNISPKKVTMTNKVIREKTACAVCTFNTSRYLKPKT